MSAAGLTDIAGFLAFFASVHRRTVRDVAALPPEAAAWRAPGEMGEGLWTLGQIVGHLAAARLLFGGAYAGQGWHLPDLAFDPDDGAAWVPVLEDSAARLESLLADTPADWLGRRVPTMDGSGTLTGWRVLLLLVEHEVHHRSQIDTYAGLAGWRVPDLFGMSFEQVRRFSGGAPAPAPDSGGAPTAPLVSGGAPAAAPLSGAPPTAPPA